MPSYHVTTFGCQMNEHDSERMKGMLESLGYAEVAVRREADLILFNTCSIREKADERFVAHLQEARAAKRARPETVIGVGGCWAQSVKEEVFERFPFVDVAFGPGQVHRLAEFLTSDSITAQGFFEFEGFTGHCPRSARARSRPGCRSASAATADVVTASCPPRAVARSRVRWTSWSPRRSGWRGRGCARSRSSARTSTPMGGTCARGVSFAELLTQVDAIEGIDRIRYTSPHPKDMREDVARAHAELPAVCEHIHLPLQSGSSRILKAMRRTYDRERYLRRVEMLREHVPDVALTTDIIVAFPGETEDDFRETLEVAEEVGYDGAFTFIYSPRRDTEAADLPGRIPHEVAVERMERLVEVVQRRARERAQRFVGRTLDVLVEGPSRTDPSRLRGRTRHNKVVNFTGVARAGEIVPVRFRAPPARHWPEMRHSWPRP